LGIVIVLLHLIAYVIYNKQAKLGLSKPNVATWGVLAFLSIINATSFNSMSQDIVVSLQFIAGAVASFSTFIYVFCIGKFSKLKPKEYVVFVLGLIAAIAYWKYKEATFANMIVLITFLISFYPTLEGVWLDPTKEKPLPWIIWTVAFFLTISNAFLRDATLVTFIMPSVLLVAHLSIAFFSRQSRKKMFWMKPYKKES
jgi:hypothetical protein